MTIDKDLDFSILATADVTQGEFAKLCGVSRITVHLWCAKGNKPNRFIRPLVKNQLNRINRAIDRANLPLPPHIGYGKGHFDAVVAAITRTN